MPDVLSPYSGCLCLFQYSRLLHHLDLPCRLWRSKVVQRSVMACICYGKLRTCWEATYYLKCLSHEERSCGHKLNVIITELDTSAICFWPTWMQKPFYSVRSHATVRCTACAALHNLNTPGMGSQIRARELVLRLEYGRLALAMANESQYNS